MGGFARGVFELPSKQVAALCARSVLPLSIHRLEEARARRKCRGPCISPTRIPGLLGAPIHSPSCCRGHPPSQAIPLRPQNGIKTQRRADKEAATPFPRAERMRHPKTTLRAKGQPPAGEEKRPSRLTLNRALA